MVLNFVFIPPSSNHLVLLYSRCSLFPLNPCTLSQPRTIIRTFANVIIPKRIEPQKGTDSTRLLSIHCTCPTCAPRECILSLWWHRCNCSFQSRRTDSLFERVNQICPSVNQEVSKHDSWEIVQLIDRCFSYRCCRHFCAFVKQLQEFYRSLVCLNEFFSRAHVPT